MLATGLACAYATSQSFAQDAAKKPNAVTGGADKMGQTSSRSLRGPTTPGTKDIPAKTSTINSAQRTATPGVKKLPDQTPHINPAQGSATLGVKKLPDLTSHINSAQGSPGAKKQ